MKDTKNYFSSMGLRTDLIIENVCQGRSINSDYEERSNVARSLSKFNNISCWLKNDVKSINFIPIRANYSEVLESETFILIN